MRGTRKYVRQLVLEWNDAFTDGSGSFLTSIPENEFPFCCDIFFYVYRSMYAKISILLIIFVISAFNSVFSNKPFLVFSVFVFERECVIHVCCWRNLQYFISMLSLVLVLTILRPVLKFFYP